MWRNNLINIHYSASWAPSLQSTKYHHPLVILLSLLLLLRVIIQKCNWGPPFFLFCPYIFWEIIEGKKYISTFISTLNFCPKLVSCISDDAYLWTCIHLIMSWAAINQSRRCNHPNSKIYLETPFLLSSLPLSLCE